LLGEYILEDFIPADISILKCIKCGSIDDLKPYPFSQITGFKTSFFIRRYRAVTSSSVAPVCRKCSSEFDIWQRYALSLGKFKACGGFSLVITVIIASWIIMSQNALGVRHLWVLVGIFGILTITMFSYVPMKKNFLQDYNPNRYMKYDFRNNFCIRPYGNSEWVHYNEWVKETMKERLTDYNYND